MAKSAKILAVYVNTAAKDAESPNWVRHAKATSLTITQNPVTQEYDFIADETASTEVEGYNPSFTQNFAILDGEPDYEFFYNLYKQKPTGIDAHKEFLSVYLKDGDNENGFYAEVQEAIVSFTDFDATGGVINVNIAFCGNRVTGKAKIANGVPTFTPDGAAQPAVLSNYENY